MTRWLNTVEIIIPDTSREKDFIDWYNTIHLPDILGTPEYLDGRLYEAKEFRDGRGKYLTMYDIETDDIDRTLAIRLKMRQQERDKGHYGNVFDYIQLMWKDVLWRQIAESTADREHNPKLQKWINLVDVHCADASREEEFNNWYTNVHLVDVLETPGFMAATRYVEKEYRDGRGKYFTLYEIETDDIDKTMAVRREKREKEREQGRYIDFVASVWRDVLWKVLTERSVTQ
jgi:hypothetical protein